MLPTWIMLLVTGVVVVRYALQVVFYNALYAGCEGNGKRRLEKLALTIAWAGMFTFYVLLAFPLGDNVQTMRIASRLVIFALSTSYILHDNGVWAHASRRIAARFWG